MSLINKCDICGGIYEADTVPASVLRIDITRYLPITNDRDYEMIDCCPKCTKKLREFVDVLKTGYDYCIHMDSTIRVE